MRELLAHRGHIVVTEHVDARAGLDPTWLRECVEELVGFSVADDESFDGVGLDSLMLITLSQRLAARCGKPVSVADLQVAGSIRAVRYLPLHTVTYRSIPFHTVTYRHVPSRAVTYRYIP